VNKLLSALSTNETDATTRADAMESVIRHYLEDKQNREEHWDETRPEVMKLLNTSELSVVYYQKIR